MAQKRKSAPEIVVAAGSSPARTRRSAPKAPAPAPAPAARTKRVVKAATPAAIELPAETELPVTEIPATPVEAVTANYQPSNEEIAALAYSYWVERGYQAGNSEQDWIRAEQELKARNGMVNAAHA
jgi:putative hemolysin